MNIKLLGHFELQHAGKRVAVSGLQAKLLALLVLESQLPNRTLSRYRVAGLLWPNSAETSARQLLSNTLYRLKQLVPELTDYVQSDQQSVQLVGTTTDLEQFYMLATSTTLSDLQHALHLYRGDLLPDTDATWLEAERRAATDIFLDILAKTYEHLHARGDFSQALLVAQRWVQADAFDERARRCLIKTYLSLGRVAAAKEQVSRFTTLLQDELATAPSPHLAKMLEDHQTQQQLPHPNLSVQLALEAETPTETPVDIFVGRLQEKQQLLQLAQDARSRDGQQGSQQLVVIEGDAGIGKSHFLRHITADLQWRGWQLGYAACSSPNNLHATSSAAPGLSPLAKSLQALTQGPRLQRFTSDLSLLTKSLLASLLPRLGAVAEAELVRPKALALALEQLIYKLCQETPVALLLDDLHNASTLCWQLLSYLLERPQPLPFLVVLSYQAKQLSTQQHTIIDALDTKLSPLRLRLSGLSRAEGQHLATQLGQLSTQDATRVDSFWQVSGGNPLQLKALLQAGDLAAEGRTLAQLFEQRLTSLSPDTLMALEAASVLGITFNHGVWQALHAEPLPIYELLQTQLIREEDDHYSFEHALLREHVYARLETRDGERQKWHLQAAEYLLYLRGHKPDQHMAWQFVQAAEYARALELYVELAQTALHHNDLEQARQYYQQGQLLLAKMPQLSFHRNTRSNDVLRLQLDVISLRLAYPKRSLAQYLADADALEQRARHLADDEVLFQIIFARLNASVSQGDVARLEQDGARILKLAKDLGDVVYEVDALLTLAEHIFTATGNVARALELAEHALPLTEQLPQQPIWRIMAYLALTVCHNDLHHYDQARGYIDDAKTHLAQHPELQNYRLNVLGIDARSRFLQGDVSYAVSTTEQLVRDYLALDFPEMVVFCYLRLSDMTTTTAHYQDAALYCETLLTYLEQNQLELPTDKLQAQLQLIFCHIQLKLLTQAAQLISQLDASSWQDSPLLESQVALVKGHYYAAQGQLQDAFTWFQTAYGTAQQAGLNEMLVTSSLELATTAIQLSQLELAEHHYQQLVHQCLHAENEIYRDYLAYLLEACPQHLIAARRQLEAHLARYSADIQHHYKQHHPLAKLVMAAWERSRQASTHVHLAKQDAPLGKRLTPAELTDVYWTPHHPTDTRIDSKAKRRQTQLQRLVAEADVYGAVPSYEDLASALKVSKRTVIRDANLLRKIGVNLPTRGNISANSALETASSPQP